MAALLRHIEGRVASIEQRKNFLIDEIQLAVDMVCKENIRNPILEGQ